MDLPEGVDFYNFKNFSGYSYVIFWNRKMEEGVFPFVQMRAIENVIMTEAPEIIIARKGIMAN